MQTKHEYTVAELAPLMLRYMLAINLAARALNRAAHARRKAAAATRKEAA